MIMLLNKLYTISQLRLNQDRTSLLADIKLDSRHPVFNGHFPGNPILPGVCTVQIIRELVEEGFHSPLLLKKAKSIKYQGFINPEAAPVLNFILQLNQTADGIIQCSANVTSGGMAVCSFKGEFTC